MFQGHSEANTDASCYAVLTRFPLDFADLAAVQRQDRAGGHNAENREVKTVSCIVCTRQCCIVATGLMENRNLWYRRPRCL
jgi:hypothetical protein